METSEIKTETEQLTEKENQKEIDTKKEHLFSIGKINKYFLFPFLCPIFCMLVNYFNSSIIEEIGNEDHSFLITSVIFSSNIGAGLLYFIPSLKIKEIVKKNEDNNKNNQNLINFFIILFVMSLSLTLSEIIDIFSEEKNVFEKRLYLLFFIPFFSKIFLKIEIYRHHIISLFISIIGLILIFIPIILVIKKEDIIINLFLFFISILYSLYIVLIRYLTHYYYVSPYLCVFFLGIFL